MLLYLFLLTFAGFAQFTEQTRCQTFRLGANLIGVGTNDHLYMRRSTSNQFSWILVPRSCCVTQVHIMKNGVILGVGRDRHIWKRRNIFAAWQRVPNSCCVKDVTTYRERCTSSWIIVGVGTNGKLYSKATLNSRWVGPYPNSGTVKAVAGVTATIYGVGTNSHIYRRTGLRGTWQHIPGSCCVNDIYVGSSQGHPTYVQRKSFNVALIGIGSNKQLYFKPTLASPWVSVAKSGSVTHITVLKNGMLVGIGTNSHLYYRTSIDDSTWAHVPHSCCVKSITELKDGAIVGVGMHNRLWVRSNLFSKWSWMVPNSGSVTRIAAGPRDEIIGIGMDRRLYRRSCLTSRWIGPLRNSGGTIDIAFGSSGRLYGVGTNKKVYMKTSNSVTSTWRILPSHNCCVIGLAAR